LQKLTGPTQLERIAVRDADAVPDSVLPFGTTPLTAWLVNRVRPAQRSLLQLPECQPGSGCRLRVGITGLLDTNEIGTNFCTRQRPIRLGEAENQGGKAGSRESNTYAHL
jgi:hypothetical protein